jgi:hypothetical protein
MGAYRQGDANGLSNADSSPPLQPIVLTGVTGVSERLSSQWKELDEISDRIVRENGVASLEAPSQPRIAGK